MTSPPTKFKPPARPKAIPLVAKKPPSKFASNLKALNPFSARGELGYLAFLGTLVGVGAIGFYLSHFANGYVERLKANSANAMDLRLSYTIWILLSVSVFWLATNAFIKRWNAITGDPSGKFERTIFRFVLLSPLLSIWFFFYTLLFGKYGIREKDFTISRFTIGAVTFLIFHACFLGYQWKKGEIALEGLDLVPTHITSTSDSIEAALPNTFLNPLVPGKRFEVHVWPYLNPLGKLSANLVSDYARLRTLWRAMGSPVSTVCEKKLGYLGMPVSDCFFFYYRKLGEARSFASPTLGLFFEARYRQAVFTSQGVNVEPLPASFESIAEKLAPTLPPSAVEKVRLPDPTDENGKPIAHGPSPTSQAMDQLVQSLLAINNLIGLLEPTSNARSLREIALNPIGPLELLASPEVPIVMLSQDTQRALLTTKMVEATKPHLQQLNKLFDSIKVQLPSDLATATAIELNDLKQRIQKLEANPVELSQ